MKRVKEAAKAAELRRVKDIEDAKAKAAALALKNKPVVKVLPKANAAVASSTNDKKGQDKAVELEKQRAIEAIRKLSKKF